MGKINTNFNRKAVFFGKIFLTAKFSPEDYIRNFKSDNMKIVLADFRRLNADSRRRPYNLSIQMVLFKFRS